MKTLILFSLLIISNQAFSQERDTVISGSDTVILVTEHMPSFPGGELALRKFISKNLKYPYKRLDVEGTVYVEFIVNEDGSVSDAKVLKGFCEPCDKNALEIFSKMPKWIPRKMFNKPVKTKMVLPVKFGLSR